MRRCLIALLLALAPATFAQPRPRQPVGPPAPRPGVLQPGPPFRPETGETVPPETFSAKNLPYVAPPRESQMLDLFAPMTTTLPGQKNEAPPRPLIIWIHGGGWSAGSKDHCPAVSMVKDGFVVASINY